MGWRGSRRPATQAELQAALEIVRTKGREGDAALAAAIASLQQARSAQAGLVSLVAQMLQSAIRGSETKES